MNTPTTACTDDMNVSVRLTQSPLNVIGGAQWLVLVLWLAPMLIASAQTGPGPQPAPSKTLAPAGFAVQQKPDRFIISADKQPIVDYVFKDEKILRPYFANAHTPSGKQVTRNHPPLESVDATDHDTMHPGIWLAFGDLSGQDLWRNKGRIEHVEFDQQPKIRPDRVTFSTVSKLLAADGKTHLGLLNSRLALAARRGYWLIVWDATLQADQQDILLGDQEEMGFGARTATPLTERNGGRVRNSAGRVGAAETWGQPANWCDYSGQIDGQPCGITLLTDPRNFRHSWWHNRDYGLMVANPFGRAAMKQGEPSLMTVKRGESMQVVFAAVLHDEVLHDGAQFDAAVAYQDFIDFLK